MKTIEEMRARLTAIVAQLAEYEALETFNDDEVETINALNEEFGKLKNSIEAKEKMAAMKVDAETPVRKTITAPVARVEVGESRKDKFYGFDSAGEYYKALIDHGRGSTDKRLTARNTAYEKIGEDGGFLVDADTSSAIMKKVKGDESLLSLTKQMTVSGNRLELPVNETAPWDSSGIQAYWDGEGVAMTDSKSKFGEFSLRLHKLTALVPVTDELLEDTVALESWINMEAPEAMVAKVNSALISGDGVGKPMGFLNQDFKVQVAAESGQTADTIVYKNVLKMDSRMIPSASPIWVAHPQGKEQLRQLKDDNGNFIYLGGGSFPNAAAPGFDTLLGRPIRYMMGGVKALGDEGDLSYVDLSYVISAIKASSVRRDVSTHVYFDQNKTAFRFVMRIAADCPFKAPITTEFGSYNMSGIVTLASR